MHHAPRRIVQLTACERPFVIALQFACQTSAPSTRLSRFISHVTTSVHLSTIQRRRIFRQSRTSIMSRAWPLIHSPTGPIFPHSRAGFRRFFIASVCIIFTEIVIILSQDYSNLLRQAGDLFASLHMA